MLCDGRLSLRERTSRLTKPSAGAFEAVAALAFFRGAKDDHQIAETRSGCTNESPR
jgi:hypothetical protein